MYERKKGVFASFGMDGDLIYSDFWGEKSQMVGEGRRKRKLGVEGRYFRSAKRSGQSCSDGGIGKRNPRGERREPWSDVGKRARNLGGFSDEPRVILVGSGPTLVMI